jgi:purine-binding chemotaxis protein CheW
VSARQFSTFTVDSQLFGVEVGDVQEVIRYQPMTPVPLAPAAVAGLINLRGQVIPAIDLRHRLVLSPRGDGARPQNVVVRTEEGPVSLLVDQIGAVVDARDDDFELPPETLVGPTRALIRGAYKLEAELLLALDVARVVELSSTSDGLTRPSPSTKGTARHGQHHC